MYCIYNYDSVSAAGDLVLQYSAAVQSGTSGGCTWSWGGGVSYPN